MNDTYLGPMAYDYEAASPSSAFDLSHYIWLFIRHLWLIIVPFCLAMLLGIYLAVSLPKIYKSTTMILIEPQKVPTSYVKGLLSNDIEYQISTLSRQVKSRTNLQKIMQEFDLLSGPEYEKMFLEEKLQKLAKRIHIDMGLEDRPKTGKNNPISVFSISYQGEDPQTVRRVTNALATYFINENLKTRESFAVGTRVFLADELANMRKRLTDVEDMLKQYRRKYMGELPEQLESNLKMLDGLQVQLSLKQQALRDEKNRLAMLEGEIQLAREETGSSTDGGEPTTLEGLKKLLENFKSRYTARHPDVIRLEKKIKAMEDEEKNVLESPPKKENNRQPESRLLPADKNMLELVLQRDAIKREIKARQQEVDQLLSKIKYYQKRVENTPKREQELLSLKRDYENIKAVYKSMLERKLEADIAVNMEKQQKGEQFRIIDPANLPQKPVSPDMQKLFLICAILGLGTGAGIVLLRDFLDSSVSKPEDLERVFGIELLAAIPRVIHTRDIVLQRVNQAAGLIGVLVSLGLAACFAAVSILNYAPAISLVSRYVDKIL